MLLINPENEHHIKQRLLERSEEEVTLRWFYDLLQMINDYLPVDWRFGVRSDEFLIRTVGDKSVTMIGETYKAFSSPDKFIHLIKTVLPMGGFVKGERFELDEDFGKVIAQRPNLYVLEFIEERRINNYIKKKWFYPVSPLAVRQYEKINLNQTDITYQYHRVHPLTKKGISLNSFGWVRWYQNGKIEWGPNIYPELEWRGESYWKIKKSIHKQDEKSILSHYLSMIKEIK